MDVPRPELILDLSGGGVTAEEVRKMFPSPVCFTAFIDGSRAPDKAGLMSALAEAFRFPAYFGKNWDALLDCLRSLPEEIPAGGYVLAIENSKMFLAASPKDLEDFLDIAGEAKKFLSGKLKIGFSIVLL